jgi:hypothetical protein
LEAHIILSRFYEITLSGCRPPSAELSPKQLNVTAGWKPFEAATDTVVEPLFPAVTVKDRGEAARLKSGGAKAVEAG